MDLPQKVRYRPYCEWSKEEIEEIKVNMQKSPWHTHYHIEPESGLLNDPNGFSYFNGKYHLFYQNWPYGPAHGLKQWVHMTSEDLVHFTRSKTRLLPDHKNDSHGAYSGSAYAVEDKLFLFTLEMCVITIGSETLFKSELGWIKMGKLKNSTRF